MSTVKKSLELAVKKKAGGKLKAVKRLWKWVTQSDGKKKKVYKDAKPATSSVLGRKGARQLAGAGDASNPSTGIQRGKQKRSGGSGNPAEQGNTIKSLLVRKPHLVHINGLRAYLKGKLWLWLMSLQN